MKKDCRAKAPRNRKTTRRAKPPKRALSEPASNQPVQTEEGASTCPPMGAFERATCCHPLTMAEDVVWEVESYFQELFPEHLAAQLAEQLAQRAERVFEANEPYRRRVSGSRGPDYITSFMRHWLSGLLRKERPDLYYRLPDSFKNGLRLPRRAPEKP